MSTLALARSISLFVVRRGDVVVNVDAAPLDHINRKRPAGKLMQTKRTKLGRRMDGD